MAKKDKLYVKRYKTLKEHRAAVAARKTLKGGKNKGPVADAAAYGETLKKKAAPTKSTSKPTPTKPTATKPTPTKPTPTKPTATKPAATTKSQASDKAKPSKPARHRGSGVRNGGNRTKEQMMIVKKALSGLTHKKGDIKKVNGITYVHDGKRFVRYTM